MREVHRLIADAIYSTELFEPMLSRIQAHKLPRTGRNVAVAGAGPTGLTAAFYLAMLGHDVTVFEERAEAGGMLSIRHSRVSFAQSQCCGGKWN